MSQNTIEQTVNTALARAGLGGYSRSVRPIVDELVQRESQIAATLIDFACDRGLDREQAMSALSNAGMHTPQVQPSAVYGGQMPQNAGTVQSAQEASAAGSDVALAETLARIDSTLDSLVGFARENGYRG